MLLYYYTYSLVFYISLPIFNPSGPSLIKNMQEIEYLPEEVCIAQCLKAKKMSQMSAVVVPQVEHGLAISNTFLPICKDECDTLNSTQRANSAPETIKQIHENYKLDLICRDESSLNLFIDLHTHNIEDKWKRKEATSSNETTESTTSEPSLSADSSTLTSSYKNENDYETVFVIKVHPINGSDKSVAYLSDDNFITLDELAPNTTYNISVMAVHSNNQYSVITQQQQFRTLHRGFTPGNVTEIKVINFTEDKLNKMHLSATLTWKPPADKTCHYDIICFSPEIVDYEMLPLEIRNPRELYKYQLENLSFASLYKVGIRSRNTKNMKESELFWKTFQAPSCVEMYNYNFNICAPDTPQNVAIEQTYVGENIYSLNITWQLPTHLPDNYTLRILDLSPRGQPVTFNLTKEMQQFFIPQIKIHDVFYEISLTANTRGGQTTFTGVTKTVVHIPENNPFVKLSAIIFAPIFCVAILSLTIFMIYHRRAKLKRYQERCKYFEELEKKAPIDPKDNFDFNKHKSNELQYHLDAEDMTLMNDQMEIDRTQLTLHEVLGEGAFGLVKRGIYKDSKEGSPYEVAVKMLKDHPSTDDVRAFRREIEVMKSVEKHPNIVGIIGHCTSYGNEMMLLTEYCSFGNLLNFLRDEWRFLHDLQQKKQTLTTRIVDVELPQVPEKLTRGANDHFKYDSSHRIPSPRTINGGFGIHDGGYKILKDDDFNTNDDVVEHFKKKYNDFSVAAAAAATTTTTTEPETTTITNCIINNNNDNNKFRVWQETLQHVDVLNNSTTTITTTSSSPHLLNQNDEKIMTQPSNGQRTPAVLSPAAENKSYGYHGCCTNSCKCDVDVVIRNIDSSDSSKDNEELDRLLRQQQFTTSCCTTIEVKNCNCKSKEQQFHYPQQQEHLKSRIEKQRQQSQQHQSQQPKDDNNQLNSAVENKSYFNIFQKSTHSPSAQPLARVKTKPPPLSMPTPTPLPSEPASPTSPATLNSEWAETFNRVPLSSGDLLDIARQVAVGMDFLAKNKVVHRDLAARNVLVSPDRTVKIADFGLSRDVYQENMYKKTGNGKLPIKWLALESMTHQVYTTQSDVWSYGILLYEIVTLGATPYPSIPTNRLLHLLKTGYRMEKPKNCGNEFYDLMSGCWNGVPNERPTFNEIIKKLDNMLNNFNNATTLLPHEGDYINDDNNLIKQESPIQQVCSDDSYLKPL